MMMVSMAEEKVFLANLQNEVIEIRRRLDWIWPQMETAERETVKECSYALNTINKRIFDRYKEI